MIRPYLKDLINEHRPTVELNNNNNNNNDNNNSNNNTNNNRAEWKIQLTMQNSCISTRSFEETCTIYTKSEPVKIFMGIFIDKLFNTLLQRFQNVQETSNDNGSEFIPDSIELLYYRFQRIDFRRAQSYIMSPDWIANKKATINPKNEKDNECFKWPIISGLNHNKINKKYLEKILKFKKVETDLSSHQRDWEVIEQNDTSIAINVLSVPYNGEELKLAYKSNFNKRKNQVIFVND